MLDHDIKATSTPRENELRLDDGSRIAVIGGGPAGSFFAYFLLDMAERMGTELAVDIYEARDFNLPAPRGCNMCGGIISESLVQALAAEGIILPTTVVQRGIDSYTMHTDLGEVRIDTPLHEKRIAAVHRGPGPRDMKESPWKSFDGHLLELAQGKGTRVINARVDSVGWDDGRPVLKTRNGDESTYDMLTVASGINTGTLKLFEGTDLEYRPPATTKTAIREYFLGRDVIAATMGSSMHVFLLDIPRLEFAALIPKGDYVTMCLLGDDIDNELITSFLHSTEVRSCFPPEWDPDQESCKCSPRISITPAVKPYADRLLFLGDCGVTRLYKDGIGAAYRTAKAAASTAVFQGISAKDFERHYWPACKKIGNDNMIGKVIFGVTRQIQKRSLFRRAVVRMTAQEQKRVDAPMHMSTVLWDMFTGSSPYREIFLRTLHPGFLTGLVRNLALSLTKPQQEESYGEVTMKKSALGKVYADREVIIRQGDVGDTMHVIQEGKVEVLTESDGTEVRLAVLGETDFFGEMALFEREVRSATVRAMGEVRILTLDKKTFLSRIQEDPSLAFHIVQTLSHRIRELDTEVSQLRAAIDSPDR